MARLAKLTEGAVERAIAEFDRMGRAAFIKKYEVGRSHKYFVDYQGRYYDSKVIVAGAYALEFPGEERLGDGT